MTREAKLLRKLPLGPDCANGVFFAPHAFEIDSARRSCKREVFGPVLHVVRYSGDKLDKVCDAINATGYGLTLGIHSRIEETAALRRASASTSATSTSTATRSAPSSACSPSAAKACRAPAPRRAGRNYLLRFALERTYTVNTTAAGGNAALLSAG